MVGDNEHPPKRRRIDVPAPIAQTNATLQYITGGRHNRWMQDYVTNESPTPAVTATASTTVRPGDAQNRRLARLPSSASVSRPDTPGCRNHNRNHWQVNGCAPPQESSVSDQQTQTASTSANVVAYQAVPLSAPSMPSASPSVAPALNARKSVDLTRVAGPGLPSPAPSDDNSNSPVLAIDASIQQRIRPAAQSHPPTENVPHHSRPHPPPTSPLATQQPFALPQSTAQHMTNAPQHLHSAANLHPAQQRQFPSHTHPPPDVQQRIISPANFQMSTQSQPPPVSAQSPTIPRVPVLPSNHPPPRPSSTLVASRIPINLLAQRIDAKAEELRRSGTLGGEDNGRIALLREAVQRGDWFYQTLSQLFCIRSVSPVLLPRSIRDLPDQCYTLVDGLLCSNTCLRPELLQFFADFPEPIMDIYSDQDQRVREVYETRVNAVKSLLTNLPKFWEAVVSKCKRLHSPPLVEDLVDILNNRSPVLQTTSFRAIARMIYSSQDNAPDGINAVEAVHSIDQNTYWAKQYRRNDAEKEQAYQVLGRVYMDWKAQLQRRRAGGAAATEFRPAPEILQFFQRPPASMVAQLMSQLSPVQQQQMQFQQRQAQQIQALDVAPSIQSPGSLQQHQLGHHHAPSPDTARQVMGSSSMNLAPHQLPWVPPRPLGHPAVHMGPAVGQAARQRRQPRLVYPLIKDIPRPQPTHPDPIRSALHEAHLREPILTRTDQKAEGPQLYRHVVGFATVPTLIRRTLSSQTIAFKATKAQFDRLPKVDTAESMPGEPRRRALGTQSLMYRLRCSVLPRGGIRTEGDWVTADNYWPDELTFEFNGTKLEPRRKLQYGRCLPIDLTDFINVGENRLKVLSIRKDNDKRPTPRYALAIEVVSVISHTTVLEKATRISFEDSLTAIKKSLSGEDNGDDDLAVTSSSLTIKLFDPYSGCKIFDIPARGASCLHKDCFDLETFLSQCKQQQPGWPIVDCWRCPLCRGDVRPQTLVVDEFLIGVRRELEERNQLDTRAIVVDADGSWKVKAEERSGVRSPSLEREEQAAKNRTSASLQPPPPPKKVIEIIELD